MAATFTRPGSGRLMMFSCTRANTSVAETTLPTPTTAAMMMQGKIPLLKPSETISPKPLTRQGFAEEQEGQHAPGREAVQQLHTEAVDEDEGHHHGQQGDPEARSPLLQLFLVQMPPWTW